MEKMNAALQTLGHFRKDKKWEGFFNKADRSKQLENDLITQAHDPHAGITELDHEAQKIKTWMSNNREKIADLTKTKEEYEAVHQVVEEIEDCHWFHLPLIPEGE